MSAYVADEWLPSKADLSAASRHQYVWAAGYISELMGAVKLAAVRPRHVQEFNAALRTKDRSSRSRQIMGKALRNALLMAVKRGYINRNPADGVPIASGERETELNFWSAAEARAFLSSDYVVADRLRPCWLFLLSTGLRPREVCALRWQDINLAAKRLTVRQAVKIDGERTGRFLRFENANGGSEHLDWHEGERSGERMRLRWYEAISGVSSMGDLYTYVPKSKNMNSDVKQVGDSL